MPIRCLNCAAISPRKLCRGGRSGASLRRELARLRDTDTPARAAPAPRDAVRSSGSAKPLGADGRHDPSPPCRTSASRTWATRWARPDRPPSRRRSRPRATGTSGSGATSRAGAARTVVCPLERTYVRTVGGGTDGSDTNTCTHCSIGPIQSRKWLVHAECRRNQAATRVAGVWFTGVRRHAEVHAGRVFGTSLELVWRDGCYACQAPHTGLRQSSSPAHPTHGEVRHRRRRPALRHDGSSR